jgi:hypothetical protein
LPLGRDNYTNLGNNSLRNDIFRGSVFFEKTVSLLLAVDKMAPMGLCLALRVIRAALGAVTASTLSLSLYAKTDK